MRTSFQLMTRRVKRELATSLLMKNCDILVKMSRFFSSPIPVIIIKVKLNFHPSYGLTSQSLISYITTLGNLFPLPPSHKKSIVSGLTINLRLGLEKQNTSLFNQFLTCHLRFMRCSSFCWLWHTLCNYGCQSIIWNLKMSPSLSTRLMLSRKDCMLHSTRLWNGGNPLFLHWNWLGQEKVFSTF